MASQQQYDWNRFVTAVPPRPSRFDHARLPSKSPADFKRANARREIERRQIERSRE